MSFLSRFRKNEKGQSLVEFALVFPIFIIMLLGIIEFGWILNGHITLTSSAREGARTAAVTNNNTQIRAAVINHLSSTSGVTVDNPTNDIRIEMVSAVNGVKVTVDGKIDPIIGFFVGNQVEVTVDATMRREFLE